MWLSWYSAYLLSRKAWVPGSALFKLNTALFKLKAGTLLKYQALGKWRQGNPMFSVIWLSREFKAILGYRRPCLKKSNELEIWFSG